MGPWRPSLFPVDYFASVCFQACDPCPKKFHCGGKLRPPVHLGMSLARSIYAANEWWDSGMRAEPFLRVAVFVPTRAAWPEGWVASGALRMAVDEVNRRSELLGGLKLQVAEKAVDCDSSSASAGLRALLEDGPVDAVIGPWCSLGCESSAYITGGLNIVQISYSCTSPVLSEKDTFPTVTLPIHDVCTCARVSCSTPPPTIASDLGSVLFAAVRAHNIELFVLDARHRRLRSMGRMDAARCSPCGGDTIHIVPTILGCRFHCAIAAPIFDRAIRVSDPGEDRAAAVSSRFGYGHSTRYANDFIRGTRTRPGGKRLGLARP